MRAASFRKLGLVSAVALVLAGGIALVRSDADVAPDSVTAEAAPMGSVLVGHR